MPRFTPDQIAEVVVDRLFRFGPPGPLAVRWKLIQADPEAAALARVFEARVRYLMENTEDPLAKFERLTGRTLPPPLAED